MEKDKTGKKILEERFAEYVKHFSALFDIILSKERTNEIVQELTDNFALWELIDAIIENNLYEHELKEPEQELDK